MAGTTTTAMRSSSRSPPFVIVGLVLALLVLAFYYWRLSTQATDLAFLLDEQKSIVRMELSKRSNNEQRMETLMNNLKACQDLVEQDKAIISEKEHTLKSLTDQLQTKEDECVGKQKTITQCEANVKKCQDDTTGVKQELDKLKEESLKKDAQIKEASNVKKCNCDQALLDQRKSIENVLKKTGAEQAIQALRSNGFPQLVDSNQPEQPAGVPPADGGKVVNQNPPLNAEGDAAKDKNGDKVPEDGGQAAEVKEENGENKEEVKKDEGNKDDEDAENHGGEDELKLAYEDNDVVGKKVIDETDGRDDEALKFKPGEE